MYDVIRMTNDAARQKAIAESFSMDLFENEAHSPENDEANFFSEAVFSEGKATIAPIIEAVQKIKDLLEEKITQQENDEKDKKAKVREFDPKAFWRSQAAKDMENIVTKIFGFRYVAIKPFIENYNSKEKKFETKILNCIVYNEDRYPIDGLVTDKGFFDSTHSLVMEIYPSLGLIKALDADEITAVLMHEFGHSIDPALVTISYTETNILSKYLTDRKNAINKPEERYLRKSELGKSKPVLLTLLANKFGINKLKTLMHSVKGSVASSFLGIFGNSKSKENKKIEKIRQIISQDKDVFNRQNFSEAFADNFARMYGMGPKLASALRKITGDVHNDIRSRYKREKARQNAIMEMTQQLIKDEHKTDIHRIRNLINEYKKDIKDPNIPEPVKKQLQDDLNELEKVLDEYLNNFDDFQNRINRVINEELMKLYKEDTDVEIDADGYIKESADGPRRRGPRDSRKSSTYFSKYVLQQADKIKKQKQKVIESKGDQKKLQSANLSLFKDKMNMIIAQFSYGCDKPGLIKLVDDAIDTAIKVPNIDYENILNLLSISVILGNEQKAKRLVNLHKRTIYADKLLKLLGSHIENGTVTLQGPITNIRVYKELDALSKSGDNESVLSKYLSSWYRYHMDSPWYDSHKGDGNTYVGYWSFEAAAIAKIMKVKETKLKEHQYYPVL